MDRAAGGFRAVTGSGGKLRFENVVFDLDGTLVDSLPGIEASLRAALMEHHPERILPAGVLRPLVGPPLAKIIGTLWPDFRHEEVAVLVTAYRAHYLAVSCEKTLPFPDADDVLRELHRAGARLFVLTNKPSAQTEMILTQQRWEGLFREISCPDDVRHPFANKADGAVSLRERHALPPAATLLVGDALDDARAAGAAGFAFAGAGYGYGNVAGHGISFGETVSSVASFGELRSIIFSKPPNHPAHDHPQPLR